MLLRGQPEPESGIITHGIQLTPANTGYPTDTTFTVWSGGTSDQTNDWDFTNMRFPDLGDYYTFGGDDDTFTNCHFQAGTLFALADNLTLVNCLFDGGVAWSSCNTVSMTGCRVINGSDLMHITGDQPGRTQCNDITIVETLVHLPLAVPGHTDGLQIRGVNGFTLLRSALDMGEWFQVGGEDVLNAAFFPEGGNGGNQNMLLDSCYFNGGGYTVRVRAATGTYEIKDCIFGPDAQFGQVTREDGGESQIVTQSGNTLWNGTPVTI